MAIEYKQLELGSWFDMPKGCNWYGEKHFWSLLPKPTTFEEFDNYIHEYFSLNSDEEGIVIAYYNYSNFAILKREKNR
jgi:hypothetical protein